MNDKKPQSPVYGLIALALVCETIVIVAYFIWGG